MWKSEDKGIRPLASRASMRCSLSQRGGADRGISVMFFYHLPFLSSSEETCRTGNPPESSHRGYGGRDKKMIYSDLTVCSLSAEAGREKRFSPPPYPLCLKKDGGIKEETTCFVGIIHKTHLLPPHSSHLTSQIVGYLHMTATYLSPCPSLSVAPLFPICRRYVPCLSFGIVVTCWLSSIPIFPTNIL